MNYYERHLGDYARDAGHLSMLEHGAYTMLLDRYYVTEKGIPEDQPYRIARARTKEEREAVDSVLKEFFRLVDGVWINNRCEEEIEAASVRINASQNNGKKGGRPRKKRTQEEPKINPTETQQVSPGLNLGSISETQTKALQSPVSSHQSPIPEERASRASTAVAARASETEPISHGDGGRPQQVSAYAAVAIPLREAGVKVTSMHPLLVGWVDAGYTLADLLGALAIARANKGEEVEIAAKYLDTIVRDPTNKPKLNGHKPETESDWFKLTEDWAAMSAEERAEYEESRKHASGH